MLLKVEITFNKTCVLLHKPLKSLTNPFQIILSVRVVTKKIIVCADNLKITVHIKK